jgi:signal transduction histidine kinase
MVRRRFFWSAHPARAILEAWLIGLAILFVLSRQVDVVPSAVLSNGLLFLCGTCGMWAVLRARLPQGSWLRQVLWEGTVGLAIGLAMAIGLQVPARWLGWESVWLQTSFSHPTVLTPLLLATGVGYVIARVGVRLWLAWERLRRRRMVWGITHTLLTLVVLLIFLGSLSMLLLSAYSPVETPGQGGTLGPLTTITERLLHTIFPGMILFTGMMAVALVFLLPPAALFSFWIARRTTRRIEDLAGAARALREGRYDTRVEVAGEDEVAQLQADFNTMAGDLGRTLHDLEVQRDTVAQLLQSRRELVASVSHELRTPVATMRATLESALSGQKGSLPASLHHDLSVVEGEVLRLQRLIEDLFALSQLEAEGLAVECQPTDIGPIVQRMVDAVAPQAWQSGRVEVIAELLPDLGQACVDEARLEQVLANLLRNGIHHTPPGGIVAVVAREEPETVVVEVRDTGEGIAPEDLPHIWQRFYRGENAQSRDGGGAGLGLALVKELVEAMGGTVAVESTVGQGSCFTVRLPLAADTGAQGH